MKMTCLEFKTKKNKISCLEFKTIKNKGKVKTENIEKL